MKSVEKLVYDIITLGGGANRYDVKYTETTNKPSLIFLNTENCNNEIDVTVINFRDGGWFDIQSFSKIMNNIHKSISKNIYPEIFGIKFEHIESIHIDGWNSDSSSIKFENGDIIMTFRTEQKESYEKVKKYLMDYFKLLNQEFKESEKKIELMEYIQKRIENIPLENLERLKTTLEVYY